MILLRATVEADGNTIIHRPATPEEIKAAHGKCGTCKWYGDGDFGDYCGHSRILTILHVHPDTDYCNHHEPKET